MQSNVKLDIKDSNFYFVLFCVEFLLKKKKNRSFGAKMADKSMNSDSSIDSVDEYGKAFRKYLSQRRKDPNDGKDTDSAAVEETLVNANELILKE